MEIIESRVHFVLDKCHLLGHFMTIMIAQPPIPLPNPNEPGSVEAHKLNVLAAFASVFDLIDRALRDSVPKARDIFALLDGPIDPSVHADLTRYLCKRFLASQNVLVQEEEAVDFEIENVPNCGLCLNNGQTQMRILKATVTGIPKASSDARSRFYSSNQFLLPFDNASHPVAQPQTPLSLVVLWSLRDKFSFAGLEIACPRREREDGSVDCYWITAWRGDEGTTLIKETGPLTPDAD